MNYSLLQLQRHLTIMLQYVQASNTAPIHAKRSLHWVREQETTVWPTEITHKA